MGCLFKFLLACAIVFCFADLIPFPELPPGLIQSMISQSQQQHR